LREDLSVGDRITGLPISPCGVCEACKNGSPQYCAMTWNEAVGLSLTNPGGYAEYSSCRPDYVKKLPDNVSFDEGCMVEPSAVSLHAVNLADVKVGDRVVLKEYMQCCDIKGYDPEDFCENCKNGEYTICSNYGEDSKVTIPTGAGFGDYYIGPETKVIKIDDNISDDQAVIIEPCAVSLHSVMKKIPEVNDKVLVIGGGMIGLNIIQCIKLFQPNCEVHVMERVKEKQEFAKKLGADFIVDCDPYEYVAKHTNAKLYKKGKYKMLLGGFEIIYDTVGKHGIFNDAIRWIKARGTYVKVGYQMTNVTFDETPIWWQEINIIGVDSYGMETYEGGKIQSFDLVVKLLNEGKLNFDGFITHRFKLSEYKKGFSQCLRKPHETIKVVLENDLDVFKK
jgi:threonine dehydrogenase-like Zn-dependent dehydrogenase